MWKFPGKTWDIDVLDRGMTESYSIVTKHQKIALGMIVLRKCSYLKNSLRKI